MPSNRRIKKTASENTLLAEARGDPALFGFLNSLVEEYEGMAVMRTVDRKIGRLKFWVPTGFKTLFAEVFEDFRERGWIEEWGFVDPWWEFSPHEPEPPIPPEIEAEFA